jgi:sugar (pentulose or hexulose) kinase
VIGQNPEASAAGAAALAGVASGLFSGLQEAVEGIAQPANRVEPRATHAQQAADLRARYSVLLQEQGEAAGGRRED